MIRRIKERLKIEDDSKDIEIEALMNQIELFICSYCNIEKIPLRLNIFIENKVIEMMLNERDLSVKSIVMEDTSITYTNNDSIFTKQELSLLRNFRRLR